MKTLGVIGSGISGLTAAYYLQDRYKVTIIEAKPFLGGHTNTIELSSGPDQGMRVDTGFIVFNKKNYPLFCRLLHELDVPYQDSDMSFGFSSIPSGVAYSSDVPFGLFATPRLLFSPRYWRFLREINRFNRIATEAYLHNTCHDETIFSFCQRHRFSSFFISHYLIPMGAAIWSTSLDETRQFPARSFLQFWHNHCLLQLTNRPVWKTITNGSKSYIEAMCKRSNWTIKCQSPVAAVHRHPDSVTVALSSGERLDFDRVILATHAPQSLALLQSPTAQEKRYLGQWQYSKNDTVLHTDTSILPNQKSAWASWMVRDYSTASSHQSLSLSYDMNRLQKLPSKSSYIVSLNTPIRINEDAIIRRIKYQHPLFNADSLGTQHALPSLNQSGPVYFCGAYFGYGFHEDGVRSAVQLLDQMAP